MALTEAQLKKASKDMNKILNLDPPIIMDKGKEKMEDEITEILDDVGVFENDGLSDATWEILAGEPFENEVAIEKFKNTENDDPGDDDPGDDDPGDDDPGDDDPDFSDMEKTELLAYIKENKLDIKTRGKDEDALEAAIREAIAEPEDEEPEQDDFDFDSLDDMSRDDMKALNDDMKLGIKISRRMSDDDLADAIEDMIKAKSRVEEESVEDEDSLIKELAEMNRKEIRAYIKDNKLPIKIGRSMTDEDIINAIINNDESPNQEGEEDMAAKKTGRKKTGRKGAVAKKEDINNDDVQAEVASEDMTIMVSSLIKNFDLTDTELFALCKEHKIKILKKVLVAKAGIIRQTMMVLAATK